MLLQTDRFRKHLGAPYTGPFELLQRNLKYFTIYISDEVYNIISTETKAYIHFEN